MMFPCSQVATRLQMCPLPLTTDGLALVFAGLGLGLELCESWGSPRNWFMHSLHPLLPWPLGT